MGQILNGKIIIIPSDKKKTAERILKLIKYFHRVVLLSNTNFMHTTQKICVSIENDLYNKLKMFKNRSNIINQALSFYLDKEDLIKESEEMIYWDNVKKSLRGENNDYISLNSNDEKINKDILEEKLWK